MRDDRGAARFCARGGWLGDAGAAGRCGTRGIGSLECGACVGVGGGLVLGAG